MHRVIPIIIFAAVIFGAGVVVKTAFFRDQPPHVLYPEKSLAHEGSDGSGNGSSGSGSSDFRDNDEENSNNRSASSSTGSSGSESGGSGTPGTSGQSVSTPKVTVPVGGLSTSGSQKIKIEVREEEDDDEDELDEDVEEVEVEDEELEDDEDVELENENGVIKIKIKKEATPAAGIAAEEKFEFKVKEGKTVLKYKIEGVGEIEIKIRGDRFEIKQEGAIDVLSSRFPLRFDNSTNQLIVRTPNGDIPIAVLPQQAVDNMQNQGLLDIIERLEIEVDQGANTPNKVVIKARGINMERFLGLLPFVVSETVNLDPQTGQVVQVQKPFPFNILDLLFI